MKFLIIPDLHGQYYTLLKMLKNFIDIKDNKITNLKDYTIILLGDLIDKGDTVEQKLLIDFIYTNLNCFVILLGNHEYKTRKKINDKEYYLSNNYDFYKELENNTELTEKFKIINDNQVKYYENDLFICTHSPCLDKHIKSKNGNMVQYAFNRKKDTDNDKDYKDYVTSFFEEIVKERNKEKYHIFGHLGFDNVIINEKQIWLDTYDIKDITFLEFNNKEMIFHNLNNKKVLIFDNYSDCLENIIKNF